MKDQKIIIFDVDGPLYPTDEETLKIIKSSLTVEQMEAHAKWDFFSILTPEEKKSLEELWEDPLFWLNLSPRLASQKSIEEARKEGHTILFATSPRESCKGWDWARSTSLKKHYGAKGREDIIITAAKEYIYGHVFIDDKPANIKVWNKRWESTNNFGLMFETNFNKYDPDAADLWPRVEIKDGNWDFIKRRKKDDTIG